tara:strand:+ start:680 stop:2383 length:1704 start_codon:yes stop_codon:yes gene_type:complete
MEEYIKHVKSEFKSLKEPRTHLDLNSTSIQIIDGGYLQPITQLHLNNDNLVHLLLKWRNSSIDTYYNSSEATFESTGNWLKNHLLGNSNKILFLVYNKNCDLVGHIGLFLDENKSYKIELDNVLRSSDSASDGTFKKAIETLELWSKNTLLSDNFYLRVLNTNKKAISYYKKLDYKVIDEEQLDEVNSFIIMSKDQIGTWKPGELVLTAGPTIGSLEKKYAADAVANGWNNQWNKYLAEYEKKFAEYVGCKYAIATSSCSGALHIALSTLKLTKNDEVIVPDITWVATANAVLWAGGTPVFADVSLETWDLDSKSVEKLINSNTKAIMPVHLYGNPCKMDEIMDLAKKHNLRVIEDAAPSIGAEYKGKRTGSFGDFGAFSFQGAKLTVTGEGGMLCTNDEELYKKAYRIADQGRIPGTFWIEELGVKYKMSNTSAAIGLGQLERVELMIEKKRIISDIYFNRLKDINGIEVWRENKNSKSIYWMSCIRVNEKSKLNRDQLMKDLKDLGVDSRPVFPSISQYPYWPKKQKAQPNSAIIAETGINLPSGVTLSSNQVNYVCDCIIKLLK